MNIQSTEHQYLKYIIEEMWESQKLTFYLFYSIYLNPWILDIYQFLVIPVLLITVARID